MKQYTLVDLQKDFPNDDACLDAIFKARYGNLKFCPHCGMKTKFYRLHKKKAYGCMQQHCGFTLSPTANMIFDHSPTPLTKWFYALYLFSVSKNGVSAMELQRHLGVTYKTAWRMRKQIRLLMQQSSNPLSGIVGIDETYIGGKHKRLDNKTAVIGMVEKRKVPVRLLRLLPSEQMPVSPCRLSRPWLNKVSNTQKMGSAPILLRVFWSQMKRSIDGTYHCVSSSTFSFT